MGGVRLRAWKVTVSLGEAVDWTSEKCLRELGRAGTRQNFQLRPVTSAWNT